jgi:hypothetical protein
VFELSPFGAKLFAFLFDFATGCAEVGPFRFQLRFG